MKKIKKSILISSLAAVAAASGVAIAIAYPNKSTKPPVDISEDSLSLVPSFAVDMKVPWGELNYSKNITYYDYGGVAHPFDINVQAQNLTGLVSQASIVESSSFKDAFGLNNYVSLGEAINKSQVTDFKIALAGSQIDNIAIVPTITTTINNETFVNRAWAASPETGCDVLNPDNYVQSSQVVNVVSFSRISFSLGTVAFTDKNTQVNTDFRLCFDLFNANDNQRASFYDVFEIAMLSGIGNPLSIQVKDGYYIKATIESNINYELEDYYSYNKSACLTIPYDDDTPDADQNQRTLSSGEKQQKFNIGGFANKMPTSSLDDWIKILAYQKDKASVLIGQLYGTIDVTMQAYVYTFSMSDIIDIVKIDGTPLESSKVQDFFNQNPDLSFSYQPSALTTITNPEANNFLTIFNENAEFKSDTFKIPSTVTSGYTGTYASPDDLVYPYSFQLNIFDQNNLLWSSVLFNISGGESSK